MLIFVHVSVYVRTIYAPIRYMSNRRSPHPALEFLYGRRTFIFSFLQLPWEDTVTRTRVSTQCAAYATFRASFINVPTYIMHMEKVTGEDPFRVVKPPNQSRAGYARRESLCPFK